MKRKKAVMIEKATMQMNRENTYISSEHRSSSHNWKDLPTLVVLEACFRQTDSQSKASIIVVQTLDYSIGNNSGRLT